MKIGTLKGRSTNLSSNSSRVSSVLLKVSSIEYTEQIQALNNKSTQADQVKISKSQKSILFYITSEIEENINTNKAIVIENRLEPHSMDINKENTNICYKQDLKTSFILYSSN